MLSADPVVTFLPRQFHDRWRDYFVYALRDTIPAAAVGVPLSFAVDQGTDFLTLAIALTTWDAAGTTAAPDAPLELRIEDSATGGLWHRGPVDAQAFGGIVQAEGPGIIALRYPRFVAGGSQVTISVTNRDAAVAYQVGIALHGVRLWRQRGFSAGG